MIRTERSPDSGRVLIVLGRITAARLRVYDKVRDLLLAGTLGCLVCCLLPALVASTSFIIFMISRCILLVFDYLLLVSIDLLMMSGEMRHQVMNLIGRAWTALFNNLRLECQLC